MKNKMFWLICMIACLFLNHAGLFASFPSQKKNNNFLDLGRPKKQTNFVFERNNSHLFENSYLATYCEIQRVSIEENKKIMDESNKRVRKMINQNYQSHLQQINVALLSQAMNGLSDK